MAKTGRLCDISPRSGRALERLGHAIDYQVDEYILEADRLSPAGPQIAAIESLMRLNRGVYYECPLFPTLREPLHAFFSILSR